MLRIVTDGAADMPSGWEEQFDIQVVPINIQLDGKTYLQGIDLSNDGFYQLVKERGKIPKTSQPSPFQFQEKYQQIAQPGDTILSMHVTSKLSGTYESAVAAAKALANKINIIPFDSGSGSAALGMMCREARLMERAGETIQRILERMEQIRRNLQIVLTLDRLDYARMSGRISAIQAVVASMLNVKPIVVLRDGVLEIADKVRTRGKALMRVLELLYDQFDGHLVNVAVVNAQDPEAARSLSESAMSMFQIREMIFTELSVAVAANLGPGTVGLVVYPFGE